MYVNIFIESIGLSDQEVACDLVSAPSLQSRGQKLQCSEMRRQWEVKSVNRESRKRFLKLLMREQREIFLKNLQILETSAILKVNVKLISEITLEFVLSTLLFALWN